MARIRTIKPEFWNNEALSAQPEATHMLAAALLNHADDEGYFNANIMLIKAACAMLREPTISIPESMNRLAAIGYLRLGVSDDQRNFGHIITFKTHQSINKPKASKIKNLRIKWGSTVDVPDDYGTTTGGNGKEGNGKELCGEDATVSDQSEDGSGTALSYPQAFEDFWLAYPTRGGRKRGKGKCYGMWRQAIREAERQPLVEAARVYAASDDSTRGFAKDPERFLAKDWWRDWLPSVETAVVQHSQPEVQRRIKPANFMQ